MTPPARGLLLRRLPQDPDPDLWGRLSNILRWLGTKGGLQYDSPLRIPDCRGAHRIVGRSETVGWGLLALEAPEGSDGVLPQVTGLVNV